MWRWRRMEEIRGTDHVRNEEVWHRPNDRNIIHTINRRKTNWVGHTLCRNCLLKHVIEGKADGGIEVTGRRRRGLRQPLDDLKEKRRYCKFKEEALDRTVWRTRFGKGYGPVVRQSTAGLKCKQASFLRVGLWVSISTMLCFFLRMRLWVQMSVYVSLFVINMHSFSFLYFLMFFVFFPL
jgi:hypothetical protein